MKEDLSLRLTALRKYYGYTQEELAIKLGVTRQAIIKWEQGETSPSIDYIKALCDFPRSSSTTLPIPSKSDGSIVLSLLRIFLVFFCSSITESSEIYASSLSRLSMLFTLFSSVLIFLPRRHNLPACTAIIQRFRQLILYNGYIFTWYSWIWTTRR